MHLYFPAPYFGLERERTWREGIGEGQRKSYLCPSSPRKPPRPPPPRPCTDLHEATAK